MGTKATRWHSHGIFISSWHKPNGSVFLMSKTLLENTASGPHLTTKHKSDQGYRTGIGAVVPTRLRTGIRQATLLVPEVPN